MRVFLLSILSTLTLAACAVETDPRTEQEPGIDEQHAVAETQQEVAGTPFVSCIRTGCSGQICASGKVITTCEWRPEYACYQTAECTVQSNGQCGWTETPELKKCLDAGGGVDTLDVVWR